MPLSIEELERLTYQIPLRNIPRQTWDAVVVGAGPAGSYAAILLANRGLQVLLVDNKQFPRDKACGDGLIADSIKCLTNVDLVEDIRRLGFETNTITAYSPSGYHVNIRGDFITLKRRHLDAIIARKATACGAVFVQGFVSDLSIQNDFDVRISITGQPCDIASRTVIIATGGNVYLPQKTSLLLEKRPSGIAVRCYIRSTFEINELVIAYDKSSLPGYAWIFPLGNNEFNVGCGDLYSCRKSGNGGLKDTFSVFLNEFPLARRLMARGQIVSPLVGCPLRCGLTGTDLTDGDRILAIGEAIGTTFPFTGEGIGKAMETGGIAAKIVSDALETNDISVLQRYPDAVRHELEDRYTGYLMAERYCSNRLLLDQVTKMAQNSTRMQRVLAEIVDETINPRSLLTVSNMFKVLRARD